MKYQIYLIDQLNDPTPFDETDEIEEMLDIAWELSSLHEESIAIKKDGQIIHYLSRLDESSLQALQDGEYDASQEAWLRASTGYIQQ